MNAYLIVTCQSTNTFVKEFNNYVA